MLKPFTLVVLSVLSVFWIYDSATQPAHSNVQGAPAGHTGAPGEQTCAKSTCHDTNGEIDKMDLISSDIPAEGYTPGTTYTIMATIDSMGVDEFGFQITAVDENDDFTGTFATINANTKLVGGDAYVTHTQAGTVASDSKTWAMEWQAPPAGTGNVAFHAAFNATNNNSGKTGDQIIVTVYDISEKIDMPMGVNDPNDNDQFMVYANTAAKQLHVQYDLDTPADVTMRLISLDGKVIQQKAFPQQRSGTQNQNWDFNTKRGVYILNLLIDDKQLSRKVVLQ